MPEAAEEEIYSYINDIKKSEGDLDVLNRAWAFVNHLKKEKKGRILLEEIVYGSKSMMDKHYYEQITSHTAQELIRSWENNINVMKQRSASEGYKDFIKKIGKEFINRYDKQNDKTEEYFLITREHVTLIFKNKTTKVVYRPTSKVKDVFGAMYDIGQEMPRKTKEIHKHIKESKSKNYIEGEVVPANVSNAFGTIKKVTSKPEYMGAPLYINDNNGAGYYFNPNLKLTFK
jgi:hypothetical protein